jgi:hypothetical protein
MRAVLVDRSARLLQARRVPPAQRPHGSRFALHLSGDAPAMGEVPAVAVPVGLAVLLGAQEVDADGREGQRRAGARRGSALLDRLEGLRTDIVAGEIAPWRLEALVRDLREQREQSADEGMDALLAEIELRAEVEIAKLARACVPAAPAP